MIYSLVDTARMENLRSCIRAAEGLQGAIVEIGVYRGGSLCEMAKVAPGRRVYGLDSFTGLIEKTVGVDLHTVGDFSDTSYEEVHRALSELSNVTVMRGCFPSDFLWFNPGAIVLGHVDVDTYRSTLRSLEWMDLCLVAGGFLVCDDYSFPDTPGARQAVHEFLGYVGVRYEVVRVVECQITMRKLC